MFTSACGSLALVEGSGLGRNLAVNLIAPGTALHKGEVLTTSGLQDAAYPALVPVAEITGFSSPSPTEESVTAVPVADLSQLDYVDVLQWPPAP